MVHLETKDDSDPGKVDTFRGLSDPHVASQFLDSIVYGPQKPSLVII